MVERQSNPIGQRGGLVVIRAVDANDLPQLSELMLEYVVDFYKQPDPGNRAVKNHIAYLLLHPDMGEQWVAEDHRTLRGFATLYFTFSTLRLQRIAILNDLYVSASVRGQGIGEALFNRAFQAGRDRGVVFLQWETTRDNLVAQHLYKKVGGTVSDLIVYHRDYPGIDDTNREG